jgi:hypothetical protein
VVRGGWGLCEVGVGKSFVVMNFIICRSTAVRAVVNYYEGQAEITHGWPISSSERRSVSGWPTAGADSAVATTLKDLRRSHHHTQKLFCLQTHTKLQQRLLHTNKSEGSRRNTPHAAAICTVSCCCYNP